MLAPMPMTVPQTPKALVRSFGSGKLVTMIERAAGARPAAPRPCRARAISSCEVPSAEAASSEPAMNRAMPPSSTRRRPRTSVSRPPISISPPKSRT